ncbi:hypothetical protein BpHYR1_023644 [Brachionus plicatilis]|uniref:Uncharacterized protein n=1 Tax=Brachionus plicatilis TaxID=10195 RepID=A0A3M7RUP5_BRAPC|nr:hypothetical protein BpHYR1_023644 [Brachionus plicatilis]
MFHLALVVENKSHYFYDILEVIEDLPRSQACIHGNIYHQYCVDNLDSSHCMYTHMSDHCSDSHPSQ